MVNLDAVFLGNFESGSPEWLALRDEPGVVTGTLAGVVAGLSPWESAFTAWAKQTKRIPSEIKQTRAMRLGQLKESVVKQLWLEENQGYKLHEVGTWSHKDFDWCRANPDGVLEFIDGELVLMEIKTARAPFDVLPTHYQAQVQWYMWVLGLKRAIVVVEAFNDIQQFDIPADEFFQQSLFEAAERFRASVINDVKPDWDGSESTYQTVRAMNPDATDETVDLGDLGVNLSNAQKAFDVAETELRSFKSATLDALGSACRGVVNVGGEEYVVVTRSVNKNGVVSLKVKG